MDNISEQQQVKHKSASTMLMLVFAFVPFIGCAIVLLVVGKSSPVFEPVVEMFKTWSAIMLSFLGGIRWGATLISSRDSPAKMSAATLLPVAGWLALFIDGPFGILALLLIYCVQGAWDSFSGSMAHAPDWYSKVRILFVLVIAACHIVAFVSVY